MLHRCAGYRLDAHADRGDVNDVIYKPSSDAAAPASADLSAWRAPVRDQGQEGSCTGESGTGAFESLLLAAGRPYLELSPQYLYHKILITENGNARHDTGASIRTIPKALHRWGLCRESLWSYAQGYAASPTQAATLDAQTRLLGSYSRVTSMDDMMRALGVDKLRLLIGVSVYQSMMTDQVAATGLVPLPKAGDGLIGGHALDCDGYVVMDGQLYFFGPNSWGNDWGGVNHAPTATGGRRGIYFMPAEFIQSADCINDVWAYSAITAAKPAPSLTA